MNAISGAGLSDAIASGVWTDQDTAIAGLTGVPAYFPDRLATIKAVDWSEVDFIMWEYGTNDFMNRVMLSDTSDPTNLYAFDNAYRHAIETILTAYPNIRIITATPIYRWWQSGGVFTDDSNTHTETDYDGGTSKLTDFVEMSQTISKEYQIPCIDDYYTLGANKFTRLAYFDSTDGTHPNANGRKRIAEHLASQLVSLI
jgi:lysophospholipase L1-like esterase